MGGRSTDWTRGEYRLQWSMSVCSSFRSVSSLTLPSSIQRYPLTNPPAAVVADQLKWLGLPAGDSVWMKLAGSSENPPEEYVKKKLSLDTVILGPASQIGRAHV